MFKTMCFLTLVNPTLMKACPKQEQFSLYFIFLMLVLQTLLITLLMSNTLSFMMTAHTALAIGLLVAFIIVGLEVRMLSSDLRQSGFLAAEGRRLSDYRLLVVRLLLALCFAYIYGLGAELILQQDAIEEVLHTQQRQANSRLYQLADKKQAAINSQVNTLQQQLTGLRADLAAQQQQLTALYQQREQQQRQQITLESLLQIEALGLAGRPPGQGVQWWEYHNQKTALKKHAQLTTDTIAKVEQQFAEKKQRAATRRDALHNAQQALTDFDKEAMVYQHLSYQAMDRDILSRYQALLHLHAHPETGASAQAVSWLIKLFIILLELAPLLAKVLFSQPSVYVERLRASLQLTAAEIRTQHKQQLQALQQTPKARVLAPELVSIAVAAHKKMA
ncbi:MAG: DUF4407 domain-containing protein [Cellvibrionaceae bacterium]|nr:DUF4407 domain-containing protein [Cellvibrionaceae bacterium]